MGCWVPSNSKNRLPTLSLKVTNWSFQKMTINSSLKTLKWRTTPIASLEFSILNSSINLQGSIPPPAASTILNMVDHRLWDKVKLTNNLKILIWVRQSFQPEALEKEKDTKTVFSSGLVLLEENDSALLRDMKRMLLKTKMTLSHLLTPGQSE